MYLRNIDGAARAANPTRSAAARKSNNTGQAPAAQASAAPSSRGAFFDLMVSAQNKPSEPVRTTTGILSSVNRTSSASSRSRIGNSSAARLLSADETSTGVRGPSRSVAPPVSNVRNSAAAAATSSSRLDASDGTAGPSDPPQAPANPVDALNGLLRKLGYDPASFNAQVTSAHIAVPGLSYDYPLLQVTVNGENVGFHLPSAMHDLRMTAANISSMMGRPVMAMSDFA